MPRRLWACMCVLFAAPCYPQISSGYISGSVVNWQGIGIRARVIAYRQMATDGAPLLSEECTDVTSADGDFSCSTLPRGSYIVEEIPLTSVGCRDNCASKGDALFYPGVSNLADAESVSVTSEEAPWIEIQGSGSPTTSISGTLAPGLSHVAFDLNTIGRGMEIRLDRAVQYESDTGSFELSGLMPGRYSLRATWMLDHAKHSAFAAVSLGEDPVTGLHLVPIEKATISGSIQAPDQIDVPMIVLRPFGTAGSPIHIPVKKDSFQVDEIKTGQYEIEVIGRGNTYISSLSWDGYPIVNVPHFQVAEGGAHVLKIVLTGPAGEVVGNLEPSPFSNNTGNADVIAVSEETNIVYHHLASRTERFSFSGLPPGFYRFYAWSRPNQAPFRIASFRGEYRDDSQEVFVDAGALEDVSDLDVIEQAP